MKSIIAIFMVCCIISVTAAPAYLPHIEEDGIIDTYENGHRVIRSSSLHTTRPVGDECYVNCNEQQILQTLGIYEDGSYEPYDYSPVFEYLDPVAFYFFLMDQYTIYGAQIFSYILSTYAPEYSWLYETSLARTPYPIFVDAPNCGAVQVIDRDLQENVNNRSVPEINVVLFRYRNTNPGCRNGGNRPHVPGTTPQVTIVSIEEYPNSQMLDTYLFDYLRDNVTQFCAKYEERCSIFYPNVDWANAAECESYMNTVPFTNNPYGIGSPFPGNTRSCRNYPLNRLIAGEQWFNVQSDQAAPICRSLGPASSVYATCVNP